MSIAITTAQRRLSALRARLGITPREAAAPATQRAGAVAHTRYPFSARC